MSIFSNGGPDENGEMKDAFFECSCGHFTLSWPVTPGIASIEDPAQTDMRAMVVEHRATCSGNPDQPSMDELGQTFADLQLRIALANKDGRLGDVVDLTRELASVAEALSATAAFERLGEDSTAESSPLNPALRDVPREKGDVDARADEDSHTVSVKIGKLDESEAIRTLKNIEDILFYLANILGTKRVSRAAITNLSHETSPSVGAPSGAGMNTHEPTDGASGPEGVVPPSAPAGPNEVPGAAGRGTAAPGITHHRFQVNLPVDGEVFEIYCIGCNGFVGRTGVTRIGRAALGHISVGCK